MNAYRTSLGGRHPRHGAPRGLFGGLAWIGAVLAWGAAAAIGAVVAFILAAGMLVVALLAVAPLAVAAATMRASRRTGAAADPDVLEARHVGGHSWVAYAADARR